MPDESGHRSYLDRKLDEAREAAQSAENEAREQVDWTFAAVVVPLAEAVRALADAVKEARDSAAF